jgi:anti-anti-sigma factor
LGTREPTDPIGGQIHRPVSHLDFTVAFDEEGAVVALSGDVDIANAPTLGFVLDGVREVGELDVRIDASRVDFIDGAGIRWLVAGATSMWAAGGRLRVEPASERVSRVLALVGLGDDLRPVANVARPGTPPTRHPVLPDGA